MTGLWQSHRDPDADLAPCQRCGKDVLLQHDPPCPHGFVACPECTHAAACRDCRRVVELEEWQAHVGPPHDLGPAKTLAEVAAEQRAHLERRRRVSGFDPVSNSYAPREKK